MKPQSSQKQLGVQTMACIVGLNSREIRLGPRNRVRGSSGDNLEDLGVLRLSSDFTVTGDMPKFSPEQER